MCFLWLYSVCFYAHMCVYSICVISIFVFILVHFCPKCTKNIFGIFFRRMKRHSGYNRSDLAGNSADNLDLGSAAVCAFRVLFAENLHPRTICRTKWQKWRTYSRPMAFADPLNLLSIEFNPCMFVNIKTLDYPFTKSVLLRFLSTPNSFSACNPFSKILPHGCLVVDANPIAVG